MSRFAFTFNERFPPIQTTSQGRKPHRRQTPGARGPGPRVRANTVQGMPSDVSRTSGRPASPGGRDAVAACGREGCLDCAKALIEGKANLDMPEPEGITPLIMAITNLHLTSLAALIKPEQIRIAGFVGTQ